MADLASSQVTILKSTREGGKSGKRALRRRMSLALSTQGGATNKILGSAMGFNYIEGCTNLCADVLYPAVPAEDGTHILLGAHADGVFTDQAVTGTIEVWGY